IQLPQPSTKANTKANYVAPQNGYTDFADVFQALQGLQNTQFNVVAAVGTTNVQVSDNNLAANQLNAYSFGAFNSDIAQKVENQAPTDISAQLQQQNNGFATMQTLFNLFGQAGFSLGKLAIDSSNPTLLDVNLDQQRHTINVGVGQIQDPYLGGNSKYYDVAKTDFDLYNNMDPYNQAPWLPSNINPNATLPNQIFDVTQAPFQADDWNFDNNPAFSTLGTSSDNVYFQSARNGRPGYDITQDLINTLGQQKIQTSDYQVEMDIRVERRT